MITKDGLKIGKHEIMGEQETHKQFMEFAMNQGMDCYVQYICLRKKFEDLLKACKNQQERNNICDIAAMEISILLFGKYDVEIIT